MGFLRSLHRHRAVVAVHCALLHRYHVSKMLMGPTYRLFTTPLARAGLLPMFTGTITTFSDLHIFGCVNLCSLQ